MLNFGHSKFLLVFLYQKGFNKLGMCIFVHKKFSEIIWNSHFWPFQIYTIFLGQIVRKNLEQPLLAILNLYQSFWEKLLEKFRMTIFGHSKFRSVFLRKIIRKNSEGHFWPFQIYTSLSGENCQKKFGTAIFGHSEFFLAIFCTNHFNRV